MSKINVKELIAKKALEFIESNIIIGIGTGSTSMTFLKLLSEEISKGNIKNIEIVPTSTEVEYMCTILNISKYVRQLWQVDEIDIVIDSADEVDKNKNLLKGSGGALTREKIIEYNAKKFIVIIESHKLVDKLGTKNPIPIEVIPISWKLTCKKIEEKFQGKCKLRILEKSKRGPVITDNGNYIIDWYVNGIENPEEIEKSIKLIPGVVEVGIFSKNYVYKVIVGFESGEVLEL